MTPAGGLGNNSIRASKGQGRASVTTRCLEHEAGCIAVFYKKKKKENTMQLAPRARDGMASHRTALTLRPFSRSRTC